MHINAVYACKSLISAAAITMTACYGFSNRFKVKKGRNWLALAMVVLAYCATLAYFDFGRYAAIPFYINRHDFFHYYMGAKYSNEVGYLYLYDCSVIVDAENGPKFKNTTIRNQTNYSYTPVKKVLAERDKYKAMFTTERWAEFEKDTLYFRELLGDTKWQRALRDKGYNATPTWNMVSRALTNIVPTDSAFGMRCLLTLDQILIVTMFLLVAWAFGWQAMVFGIIFYGTNFAMHQTHIKGSLLRHDWVTMVMMGMCCLKMKRYKTAGALMAYPAMSRIFPTMFAFGFGAKFVVDFVRDKFVRRNSFMETVRANRRYIEFFIVFGLVITIMLSASIVSDGGTAHWRSFLKLIHMHDDDVVSYRVGFKFVFLGTMHDTDNKHVKNQQFHDRQILWWSIQCAILALTFFLVRKLDDYETVPYSFVPVFFMFAPTFYYYVMLIVPLYMFVPKIHRANRAVGACMVFAMSTAGYVLLNVPMKLSFALFFWMSVMALVLAVYIMATAFVAGREKRDETDEKSVSTADRVELLSGVQPPDSEQGSPVL